MEAIGVTAEAAPGKRRSDGRDAAELALVPTGHVPGIGSTGPATAVAGLVFAHDDQVRRSAVGHDDLGGTAAPSSVLAALRRRCGRGEALPADVSATMSNQLNCDLSPVRLHRDAEADAIARSVDAVAFTYGADIYFSDGSFDLSADRGRHLLAHELAHVADTAAVPGSDGQIGRADDPAERRADRTAAAVLPALRRQARLHSENTPRSTVSTAGALRRKVGFEFETPWEIKAPGGLIGSDTPVITGSEGYDDERTEMWHASPDMKPPIGADGNLRSEFMPKTKTVPHKHLGFLGMTETVTELPKYTGFGNLEFITEAFEESDEGLAALRRSIKSIVAVVKSLSTYYPGDIPVAKVLNISVAWGSFVAGKARRDDIVVDTRPTDNAADGKRLWASIQMTGGIKLGQIPKLLTTLAAGGGDSARLLHRGPLALAATYLASATAAATELRDHPGDHYTALEGEAKRAYAGAVAHLADIIRRGAVANAGTDQAKYVSPLMSRTDFGKLPDAIRGAPDFARHVLAVGGVNPGAKLFPVAPLWQGTVQEWVDAVIAGSDPVNWGQDKADPRWQPQQVGQADDQAVGHVYEFRALNPHLYVEDWEAAAIELFQLVRRVNASA